VSKKSEKSIRHIYMQIPFLGPAVLSAEAVSAIRSLQIK
jgi:hypothetical protein